MMQIVICEDDILSSNLVEETIKNWSNQTERYDIEVKAFHSSEDLLEAWIRNLRVHMFILDIEFNDEISGMELAQTIRKTSPDVPIVFISNYEEYVYQGYTFGALRYLKKTLLDSDLFSCLDIAYRYYTYLHQESAIISIPYAQIVLKYSEILYIEAKSPDLYIYTTNTKFPLIIRYQLKSIRNILPSSLFVHCHRSYMVNISQIRVLKRTHLLLSNGLELPISAKYVEQLFNCFVHFHQEGFHEL